MSTRRRRGWFGAALVVLGAALPFPLRAQSKTAVELERREFAEWLRTAPVSPWRAVVVQPIGGGVSLGPAGADVPLAGVDSSRLTELDGRISLQQVGRAVPVARGRAIAMGAWRLVVSGPPGRSAVTVYRATAAGKPLAYYSYNPGSAYLVALEPPAEPRTQRLLAPDGIEVDAGDAGTVTVVIGGGSRTLRVMRLPGATEDETELEIYFRDGTSGHGSYPAGRFVSLLPQPGGRYLLDFNRARNPFCAYNTVYPCPAPWRGNALTAPVAAGERYTGGGLETTPQ